MSVSVLKVADLREYQRRGAAFLAARKRAILGDEMGLGKSAQAITAADLIEASAGPRDLLRFRSPALAA